MAIMGIQKTSKNIPSRPRYDLVRRVVVRTLLISASNKIPIKLTDIINCYDDIELRSYKWYQENMNVTLDYVINKVAKSEEGSLLELSDDIGNLEYFLLYNNDKMLGRQRFTIAHELGHYLLDHHSMIDDSVISRGGLNKPEYDVLEKEANLFARMVLVPLPLISYMAKSWGPIKKEHLMTMFNITYTVSGNVISHLNNLRKRGSIPVNNNIVNKYKTCLDKYINIHICNHCHSEFIWDSPSYCPICGDDNIIRIMSKDYEVYYDFERNDYMIYDGIEVDKKSKAIICPICQNEEPEENGEYCPICGQLLVNKCTNVDHYNRSPFDGDICGALLPGNARYCIYCGAPSTFLQEGLLKSWDNAIDGSDDEYSQNEFIVDDIPF